MIEDRLASLLQFVAENDGSSLARTAKQLEISQSELLRMLAVLGNDPTLGGLGLIDAEPDGTRRLLHLTDRGRVWLSQHA